MYNYPLNEDLYNRNDFNSPIEFEKNDYYEFDDYGKWHHPTKEMKTYDVDNHFVIFRLKRIYKSYKKSC